MHILVDLQALQNMNRDRGIGRYIRSFVKELLRETRGKHSVDFLINDLLPYRKSLAEWVVSHSSSSAVYRFVPLSPTNERASENLPRALISEEVRNATIAEINPDITIVGSHFEGLWDDSVVSIGECSKTFTAVILYDLIPWIDQEEYFQDARFAAWYERKFENLRRADILLPISDAVRNEARIYLDWPIDRMSPIYAGVDPFFHPVPVEMDVLKKWGIDRPFIMTTSAFEPRKNFEGLIQAYSLLPDSLQKEYLLVLVCRLDQRSRNALHAAIAHAGVEGKVILTDYVEDEVLRLLYCAATLFVFASRHEGFGLPPLEAMACGTAAIVSDTSSLPEVMGFDEALFDPSDPEKIAEKMIQLLTDANLRERLQRYGPHRAARFRWERTAEEALSFIQESFERAKLFVSSLCSPSPKESILRIVEASDAPQLLSTAFQVLEKSLAGVKETSSSVPSVRWRIEGPFDSSYSLALLNRETARELEALGYEVVLHSTDGPGDYEPDPIFLASNPDLKAMYERSKVLPPSAADLQSRLLYPPRVQDMQAPVKMLHHYAWEESGFPMEWVDEFNAHLGGITVLSEHVRKIMIDHGVTVPISVSGCGVDHLEDRNPEPMMLPKLGKVRFLHVSSCFPRKGVDVLLEAFCRVFDRNDDVSLLIKTFPNPHNDIVQIVEKKRSENPNFPTIYIVNEDLSDAQMKYLYEISHILVAPSRAEGFGLPLAEAMLMGLSVVTTGWGGQRDFCTEETSWLVDYRFEYAKTHFGIFDSVWAEPQIEDLAQILRRLYEMPERERRKKSDEGRRRLLKHDRWGHVVRRLESFARETLPSSKPNPGPMKIGWVSTWNVRCGIAGYSKDLVSYFQSPVTILAPLLDEPSDETEERVKRCWEISQDETLERLEQVVEEEGISALVIQFNYGFFDFKAFSRFLERQKAAGRTILVTLHATLDPRHAPEKRLGDLLSSLRLCDRLLVHSVADLNRLKCLGLVDNAVLFPHGMPPFEPSKTVEKDHRSFHLATYGFFLPHKGLLESIEAFAKLRKRRSGLRLTMINAQYPTPESAALVEEARKKIEALRLEEAIELMTDYRTQEECLEEISKADLVIFPYRETAESSSAAARYALAAGVPTAVTTQPIFDDLGDAVMRFGYESEDSLAIEIERCIDAICRNDVESVRLREAQRAWRESHRSDKVAKRLERMITSLAINKK